MAHSFVFRGGSTSGTFDKKSRSTAGPAGPENTGSRGFLGKDCHPTKTSWWLNHPSEKYARQIGSFPQIRMKIKKYFKPPPRKPPKKSSQQKTDSSHLKMGLPKWKFHLPKGANCQFQTGWTLEPLLETNGLGPENDDFQVGISSKGPSFSGSSR